MQKKPSYKAASLTPSADLTASFCWQLSFMRKIIICIIGSALWATAASAAYNPNDAKAAPPAWQDLNMPKRLAVMSADVADPIMPLPKAKKNMDDIELDMFILGRSFFSIPWVIAPSATTARDGLGPLFNANTCTSCHRDGLSSDVDFANPSRSLVIKLGMPKEHHKRGNQMLVGDPVYGAQLAINGAGSVPFEGTPEFTLKKSSVRFADGSVLNLTKPIVKLTHLQYGKLNPATIFGVRQSPSIVGLGWLMLVSDAAILKNADPEDKNADGIRGRVNWIFDLNSQRLQIGRFGYKATQRTLLTQSADAAANDMGLTNRLYKHELCTRYQKACQQAPRGRANTVDSLDLPDERLEAIAYYVHNLPAPPQATQLNKTQQQGQKIFEEIGCSSCHLPALPTIAGIEIAPYSDLLLHDMGSDLADGRREYQASGSDWRTAPLWGTGKKNQLGKHFLHDGRATSTAEAIAWHGGEAQNAKRKFLQLSLTQRQALLAFLDAL